MEEQKMIVSFLSYFNTEIQNLLDEQIVCCRIVTITFQFLNSKIRNWKNKEWFSLLMSYFNIEIKKYILGSEKNDSLV